MIKTKYANRSKAFLKLYKNSHKDLEKYILKLVNGNKYLSEEIIQKTYLCATENQDTLLEHPNPAGWLFVTAKNLYYKEMKTIVEYNAHEIELPDDVSDGTEIDFLSDEDEKYDELLKYIIENLRGKEVRLFEDYYVKNIPLKEIAINMKENYVNMRKFNSRLKIKLIALIKNRK